MSRDTSLRVAQVQLHAYIHVHSEVERSRVDLSVSLSYKYLYKLIIPSMGARHEYLEFVKSRMFSTVVRPGVIRTPLLTRTVRRDGLQQNLDEIPPCIAGFLCSCRVNVKRKEKVTQTLTTSA